MIIVNEMSDEAVLRELGSRIAASRISMCMTQATLAQRAGVSKRSVERLEKGEGGVCLQIVIAIARVLRRLGGLNVFIPEVEQSPYDIVAKVESAPKRVRPRKQKKQAVKWKE